MKSAIKILFIFGFVVMSAGKCVPQAVTWQRLYNYSGQDVGYSICKADGTNFYLVGKALVYPTGDRNRIWIIKINEYGDTLWSKVIGNSECEGYGAVSSHDGGCVIVGTCNFSCSFKIDQFGNEIWSRSYGGAGVQCYDIIKTSDEGYLACGRINLKDGYLLKIDSTGLFEWQKTFSTPSTFRSFHSVVESDNKKIFVCGSFTPTSPPTLGNILSVNYLGNTIFDTLFQINNLPTNAKSINISGNRIIVGGGCGFSPIKYYVASFSTGGNILSNHIFQTNRNEYFLAMSVLNENKYLISTERDSISIYAKLIMTDSLGIIFNQKEFFSVNDNNFVSILPLENRDIMFLGNYSNSQIFNSDFYAIRTDSNLNSPTLGILNSEKNLTKNFELFQNYPNPFNPYTKIEYSISETYFVSLEVINILGKQIETLVFEKQQPGNYYVNFSGNDLPSGIYFCKLDISTRLQKFTSLKKMILIK